MIQASLAILLLFSTCFLFPAKGAQPLPHGVPLGDHRIAYLNPLTGEAAACSSYVFAADEYQPQSSECVSQAEVFLSFTAPGALAFCTGMTNRKFFESPQQNYSQV
jgi:hypothetical protein